MKRIVAIFLLSGFLLQTSAKLAIILNFKANQDFIAKSLCINRKKPKSSCKGSCQLKKKLNQEEKSETQVPGGVKDKFEILPCTIAEESALNFQKPPVQNNFSYENNYSFISGTSFFHPPNLAT